MRNLRKAIFWLHLTAGLLAGIIILVMAVTGVLLTYERQIVEWADGLSIPPHAEQIEPLLSAHVGDDPAPTAILVDRDPSKPVALKFGRSHTEFFDPGSGESLGEGNLVVRKFFRTMLTWHRWLGREGAAKPVGRAIIGAGNLGFLFLVISGIVLWFPKRWNRLALKAIVFFQKRLKGRSRDWNWHHVFGFWACLPLLAIVVSGVVMSYPWANEIVYRLAGEEAPGHSRRRDRADGSAIAAPVSVAGVDAALEVVKAANPEWQTIELQLPPREEAEFTVMDSHRGRPDKRRGVTVNLATTEIVKTEGMEMQSPARKARTWIRWVHTGEAGGWIGQTIAGLASVSAVMLVWTGFALSWRRFLKRRRA